MYILSENKGAMVLGYGEGGEEAGEMSGEVIGRVMGTGDGRDEVCL